MTPSPGPKVVIRADASNRVGAGHIMRCLTLANSLAEQGAHIAFACAIIPNHLADRIQAAGHLLHRIDPAEDLKSEAAGWDTSLLSSTDQRRDAQRTLAAAGHADWLVLDHYRLAADWLDVAGHRSRLVIDDMANRHHHCEMLVDQTAGRDASEYRPLVPDGCRILTGAHYALLRPEFAAGRSAALTRREQGGPIRRLLIALGSTDIGNVTLAALKAVRAADLSVATDVVLGPDAPSHAEIEAVATQDPLVHLHVDTRDMAGLMARADVAIGAAGTSSWERCCLGLPAVTLVLADNQRKVAENLERAGAIMVAANTESITPILRKLAQDEALRFSLSAAAAALTDGLGAERIANALLRHSGEPRITPQLRPARPDDSRLAWLWRNDPATRGASRSSDPIRWPDHDQWWTSMLESDDRHTFIAEAGAVPVAVLRFDRVRDGSFEVSINLSPSLRGSGLGGQILADGCTSFARDQGPVRLMATIHPDNIASRRIFERVGFVRIGPLSGSPFDRYERSEGVAD